MMNADNCSRLGSNSWTTLPLLYMMLAPRWVVLLLHVIFELAVVQSGPGTTTKTTRTPGDRGPLTVGMKHRRLHRVLLVPRRLLRP